MNADKIAKELGKSIRKTKAFENGTIIAWDSTSTRGITYKYAAVFANGYWYTTAANNTRYMTSMMSNEEMMKYLGEMENVGNIRVAETFVEVEL